MFQNRVKLFELLGFQVNIDISWIIIAVLVTWSLSVGLFPYLYEGLPTQTYWIMGIVGALGLFFSIIVHEFSHSLVARSYGMPMKGITLFIFGGVAEMGEEPPSPRAEFMMAIVGPITSMVLALIFYVIYNFGHQIGWSVAIIGVVGYLAMINAILAGFNILPAFPLDGGRVLRSILWGWKNNLRWATRISSRIGSGFGIVLIFLAVLQVLNGNFIAGMWWFLIGMFLRGAAQMSYQQVLARQTLEGEPVRRFMQPNPITVTSSTTVKDLVEDYVYKYHFKMFPVVDNDQLKGCITTKQVKAIPREQWSQKTVGEVANPCSDQNTISPETDAIQALALMNRTESSRLMVTENGRLMGVISLKDLMGLLSLKVELED
ncbi:MAG: site-2 protease family protein [Desulfobacteraceae bacterium]